MSEQGESGKSKQRLAWATGNMALSWTEMGKAMGKKGLAGDGERRSEVQVRTGHVEMPTSHTGEMFSVKLGIQIRI